MSASETPLAIFQIPLTHIYTTITVDPHVVARGWSTIFKVLDLDGAYRIDVDASAVRFVCLLGPFADVLDAFFESGFFRFVTVLDIDLAEVL